MQSPPPGDPPNQHAHPRASTSALPFRRALSSLTNLERRKWGRATGENGQGDACVYGRESG
eukprot:1450659-Alexandrium_andersonii.AAC.1